MNTYELLGILHKVRWACMTSPDLLKPEYRERVLNGAHPITGHCYIATEALYHLGAKLAGYEPHFIRYEGEPHWFLKHKRTGAVLDPTAEQFDTKVPYSDGKGKGFLTREPSKRAKKIMEKVLGTNKEWLG